MKTRQRLWPHLPTLLLLTILFAMTACSSPEEKKAVFFDKGKALFVQKEFSKARLEFKNALQIDPKFAEGYLYLGKTELKTGDANQAYAAFSKAISLQPGLWEAHLDLGQLLLLAGQPTKAAEQADTILNAQPDDAKALYLKAASLLKLKKPDESLAILQDLRTKGNSEAETYLLLASSHEILQDLDAAEKAYKDGLAANKEAVELKLALARYYSRHKRYREAAVIIAQQSQEDPDNSGLKLNLIGLTHEAGDKDKAMAMADKLFSQSEDSGILQNLVKFYLSNRQVEKAEQQLLSAINRLTENYDLRISLSEIYLLSRQPVKALAILEQGLIQDKDPGAPGIIKSKNAIARIKVAQGKHTEALSLIEEVLAENPKDIDAHFLKGTIQLQQGDPASAVAEFRTVVNERPQMLMASLRLAEAHMANKEVELAGDVLHTARQAQPNSREALTALVKYHVYNKDFALAEETLTSHLAKHEHDHQSRIALGDIYVMQQKFDLAQETYQRLTKVKGLTTAYLRLSRLLWQQKKQDEALAVLHEGYKKQPQSGQLLTTICRLYISKGQFNKAAAICQQHIKNQPKGAGGHNLLGQVYTAWGKFPEAQQSFERAIEIQPNWNQPHQNIASLYIRQGKPEVAIAQYRKAQQANPQQMENYLALGLLYERTAAHKQAEEIYRQAFSVNDKFWPAYNNLAFLLANQQDAAKLAEALQLAKQALALNPGGSEVLDTLGFILLKQGNLVAARTNLEKGLEKASDSPDLNYHMALLLIQEKRPTEARQHLETAIQSQNFYFRKEAEQLLATL